MTQFYNYKFKTGTGVYDFLVNNPSEIITVDTIDQNRELFDLGCAVYTVDKCIEEYNDVAHPKYHPGSAGCAGDTEGAKKILIALDYLYYIGENSKLANVVVNDCLIDLAKDTYIAFVVYKLNHEYKAQHRTLFCNEQRNDLLEVKFDMLDKKFCGDSLLGKLEIITLTDSSDLIMCNVGSLLYIPKIAMSEAKIQSSSYLDFEDTCVVEAYRNPFSWQCVIDDSVAEKYDYYKMTVNGYVGWAKGNDCYRVVNFNNKKYVIRPILTNEENVAYKNLKLQKLLTQK